MTEPQDQVEIIIDMIMIITHIVEIITVVIDRPVEEGGMIVQEDHVLEVIQEEVVVLLEIEMIDIKEIIEEIIIITIIKEFMLKSTLMLTLLLQKEMVQHQFVKWLLLVTLKRKLLI